MTPPLDSGHRRMPTKRSWILLVLALPAALLLWAAWPSRYGGSSLGALFVVRRGPLEISVSEGGSIQALESQEIKCEVRVGFQGTKILKIVEEGYQVTDEDVKNGKVLVELDSSELQKLYAQQEIQYQSAKAALTDAQKAYEIQLNQNISDIKSAEQKARFARMDFEKFLGDDLAEKIIHQVGLTEPASRNLAVAEPATEVTNRFGQASPSEPPPPTGPSQIHSEVRVISPGDALNSVAETPNHARSFTPSSSKADPASAALDDIFREGLEAYTNALGKSLLFEFAPYAKLDLLGDGEAKQKLRKFEDDLQVAKKELGQAEVTLEGTRRLFEKGFVTRTDLQRDEIAHDNSRLKVQTAETARDLFLKYEFKKTSEETLSKYAEAVRELDRAGKAAEAKLAQAEAKLRSAQASYAVQRRQLDDLSVQLDKCLIRARKTGLVVYGGNRNNVFYGEEQIREGATVREHQAIITIPDMTQMGVQVKIHESYIKKIKKGQEARITVDAFPEEILEGDVLKVGVLPDSQNRWMNPDIKVYVTMVRIDGDQDWLKPGMSANVQVFVDRLDDVLYVPIQCIVPDGGKRYCYVSHSSKAERREVETGQFNDEFIEIKKGLTAGESVMLRPPSREVSKAESSPTPANPPPDKTPDSAPERKKPSSPPVGSSGQTTPE